MKTTILIVFVGIIGLISLRNLYKMFKGSSGCSCGNDKGECKLKKKCKH